MPERVHFFTTRNSKCILCYSVEIQYRYGLSVSKMSESLRFIVTTVYFNVIPNIIRVTHD